MFWFRNDLLWTGLGGSYFLWSKTNNHTKTNTYASVQGKHCINNVYMIWNAFLHKILFPRSGNFSLTSCVNSYNFVWKIGKHLFLLILPTYLHSWKQFFSWTIFKQLNLQSCTPSIWIASSDSEITETAVQYITGRMPACFQDLLKY